MENKQYYIKYLTNLPVGLKIHTLITTTGLWVQTLFTVGDLVAAYKTAVAPLLDHSSVAQLTLHYINNGLEMTYNSYDPLTVLGRNGTNGTSPLIIRSVIAIDVFLSNILPDIEKALEKPSMTGTQRNHPRTPRIVGRWEDFLTDAATYEYPKTPIGKDVVLPITTENKFKLERDVDKVIGIHLDIFNRIFRDQGKACRFESKATVFASTPKTKSPKNLFKFIGVPDNVLTINSQVLSFVEDKTPSDLPVLLEMYNEDKPYKRAKITRGNIGRMDVRTVIEQVYGYLSLNNLIYGCVTCYDVTYFLWRPLQHTLLISHPIFNHSRDPTLLQALYYFAHLVLKGHLNAEQKLVKSPESSDEETTSYKEMDGDEHSTKGDSDSGSNYSISNRRKRKRNVQNKRTKYNLNLDSFRSGTVVGSGATGQVILLKDSDIVVKHCDSYNNPDGFQMLQNEISVYERLTKFNLQYIPRYYGECEFYGQHFIALEYIPGKHCDWRTNTEWKSKLDFVIRDLKSFGVVHQDLRPENVLLTPEGDIKLIDFGKADI